ncbi:VanZ like family protein [Planctomycetes bacterium Pla163]|uniref:VanZ like family protein n=1 Tax=Rohdeia mirabilis TaxID=2528008 RepID=A0A518CXZ5_9BACT|nr:VanZ like family protein [Planctomycetes bacterium Pla163]
MERDEIEDAVAARGSLGLVRRLGFALLALPRPAGVLLAAAWMAFSWWLSSGTHGPQDGGPWWGFLSNLAHAPLFGLLALWWIVALPRRDAPLRWARLGAREMGLVVLLVLAWGAVDEWHQSGVDGRVASWTDLVTDGVGATAVLVVAAYAGRSDARAAGLVARLVIGLAACALAAGVATAI